MPNTTMAKSVSCEELLEQLQARNVELDLEGGRLHYRAPKGALSAELRRALEERRAEIVAHLEGRRDGDAGRGPVSRSGCDIAVIGMACRFPQAPDLESFWGLLRDGRDAVGQAPASRRSIAESMVRLLPGDASMASMITDALDTFGFRGSWVEGIEDFDPIAFGITPREARAIAPEHRLALEVAWETLEHAGYGGDALAGSRTGVFFGGSQTDWGIVAVAGGLEVSGMIATGNATSMNANRISYHLNLCGPSLAVDTACSSSLFAVHLARRALLAGDCDVALAGGVSLLLNPVTTLAFGRGAMLARDGRCKAFDARADGYVRGEGVGAVLLKPLDRARRDGDRVYGIVKGSAVNHDGHSKIGLAAPSPKAQTALLLAAFADAGIDPSTLSYIEAHGTGTRLGDPVEIEGLTQAFRAYTDRRGFCAIGTVKTNIGHLEAAAGAAGLLKTLLALERKQIPASLHFETPNPHIRFEETPFQVNRALRDWTSDGPRRAGVSSFGFGGANAHVVLEEGDARAEDRADAPARPAYLLPLSARTQPALARLVERYREYLAGEPAPLRDVCFTASAGRPHFEHRLTITATSIEHLRAILAGLRVSAGDANGRAVRYAFAPRSSRRRSRSMTAPALEAADAEGWSRVLADVAAAYVAGGAIDWPSLYAGERPRRAPLPTYPFERRRCWLNATPENDAAERAEEDAAGTDGAAPIDVEDAAAPASGEINGAIRRPQAERREEGGTVKAHPELASVQEENDRPATATAVPPPAESPGVSPDRAARVVCARPGSVAGLATRAEERPAAIGADQVEIAVRAAGLNFLDVLAVLDPNAAALDQLGVECAGTVTRVGEGVSTLRPGDDVVAIVPGSFATHVTTAADLVAPMPPALAFEEAATIPIAFVTADYALRHEGRLCAGERVLIHSAAGGVGFAAVQIAQRIGAEIVATAGNEEKREFLRAQGVRHVLDSRSTRFADEARAAAGGGVDVVLNSLPGDAIAQGLSLLEPYGRFLEIGKADIRRNAGLGLGAFSNCLRYVAIDLQRMCIDRRALVRATLLDLLERFRTGELRPLPLRAFRFRDADGAFRHMAQRKNLGKVVLVPDAPASAAAEAEPPAAASTAEPAAMDEPSPLALVGDALQKQVPRLSALYGIERYGDFAREVDCVAAALTWEAFGRLGWAPQQGERFRRAQLMERLGIRPSFERLVERTLGVLAEEGILAADGDQLEVRELPRFEDVGAHLARLQETYPAFDAQLVLLGRCSAELHDVLRGRVDPVSLLFPGGRLDLLESLYQDPPLSRFFNSLAGQAVEEAVCRSGGDLRILEIGAGTGSTTASILPKLPGGRSEYVYTDVSKLFTRHGKRKFENYRNVRYELLDIESDPETQGFAAASFDLVVASNVLHATADLKRSLAHARTLLKAGGWLVLVEMTRPSRWLDLVFGLLEGWRKFQDEDVRSETPLLGADTWLDLLREAGFAEALTLPRQADLDVGQALAIARLDGTRDAQVEAAPAADAASPGAESPVRDLTQWFYDLRWEARSRPEIWTRADAALPMRAGRWLVFDEGDGFGRTMAAALAEHGGRCILVSPTDGEETFDLEQGRATVSPHRAQAMRALLDRIAQAEGPPLHGILYLWSLTAPRAEETTPAGLDRAETYGSVGALNLVQALAGLRWSEPPRLWLVTRGAQVVGTAPARVAIGQSPLWGLGRVIGLEHPELRCVRIDLDPESSQDGVQALLDEVRFEEYEDQIALRGGERYVLRLVRTPRETFLGGNGKDRSEEPSNGHDTTHAQVPVRADATYLVTGGLGGLGLVVAEWLAARGARHLVLVGRRGTTDAAQGVRDTLARLKAAGVKVVVMAADVTHADAVARMIARIDEEMPPLRGVIHAAGILDDDVLLELDEKRLHAVMAPKVRGAWNLHVATATAPLDFFVLFSSMVSMLGSLGQGNYAAANAFLDTLAHYRRSRGQTALSVNWGPWSEVGLVAGEERSPWLALGGIDSISPTQGRTVLELLLPADVAQIGVLSVNWRRWRQLYPGASEAPALAELMADEAVVLPKLAATPHSGRISREAVLEAAPEERAHMLEVYLRELVAAAFELPASDIDPRLPLTSMGLESLMAVEVRNEIEADLGISISMVDFVEGPSIADLVTGLLRQITGEATGSRANGSGADAEWEEFRL